MPTSQLGLATVGGTALSSATGTGVTLDMSTVQNGLKELYDRASWLTALYEHDGLFTRMPKFENFTGSYYPVLCQYAPNSRRSQDFGRAQDNTSSFEMTKFLVHRVRDYAFATLDSEAILASRGDAGAFASYLDVEISGARYALRRSLSRSVYGDGTGKIGVIQVSTPGSGTTVIELSQASDIVNFEVGMVLECILGADVGTPTQSGATLTVTAVDRENGKFTATTPVFDTDNSVCGGGIGRLFAQGDSAAAAASHRRMSGVDAWLPATAPTSGDSFFGVDRSTDVTRLAGHRFTGVTTDVFHSFVSANERLGREGAKPDHIFCDYTTYTGLMKESSSGGGTGTGTMTLPTNKGLKVDIGYGKTLELGFTGIVIHMPTGPITVVPDADCPANTAYMLKLSDWELASLGMCPQILDLDGNGSLRISTRDSMEVRLGAYANVICRNPGNQSRIDFS